MKQSMLFCLVLALAAGFVACGGSNPAGPSPTPTPSEAPPPPVNSFQLQGFSPAAGSALTWGDGIRVTGAYTLASESYNVGLAIVREDGEGMITDTTVGYRSQARPCPITDGFNLDPRNFAYHFMKRHVSDIYFVIGDEKMMGSGSSLEKGNLDWNQVVYKFKVATGYVIQ